MDRIVVITKLCKLHALTMQKSVGHGGTNHGCDHGDFVGMIFYCHIKGPQCLKTPHSSVPIDDNRAKYVKKQIIYGANSVQNTKLIRSFPTNKTELNDVCHVQLFI